MNDMQILTITFDTKLFPAPAILAASHKFLAKCFVKLEFSESDSRMIIVELKPREHVPIDGLEDQFREEALNYAVKQKISKGSAKIRDQIFHIVFNRDRLNELGGQLQSELKTAVDPESVKLSARLEKLLEDIENEESLDYEDDPLGISIPWEEKHGMPKDMLHPIKQMKERDESLLVPEEAVKDK